MSMSIDGTCPAAAAPASTWPLHPPTFPTTALSIGIRRRRGSGNGAITDAVSEEELAGGGAAAAPASRRGCRHAPGLRRQRGWLRRGVPSFQAALPLIAGLLAPQRASAWCLHGRPRSRRHSACREAWLRGSEAAGGCPSPPIILQSPLQPHQAPRTAVRTWGSPGRPCRGAASVAAAPPPVLTAPLRAR